MKDVIVFKGVQNGLELYIDGNQSFPVVVAHLLEKLKASSSFFNAGLEVTIICKDRELTSEEIESLLLILQKNELFLKGVLRETAKRNRPVMKRPKEISSVSKDQIESEIHEINETELRSVEDLEWESQSDSSEYLEEEVRLFTPSEESRKERLLPEQIAEKKEILTIQRTIRNGQQINHEGTIVILGDVNPGSEIVAGGDIIIYGNCRGVVQAGVPDYQKATITATKLMATQIRIAHIVARSPDNRELPEHAEKAMIKDGKIFIEKI